MREILSPCFGGFPKIHRVNIGKGGLSLLLFRSEQTNRSFFAITFVVFKLLPKLKEKNDKDLFGRKMAS